MSNKLCIVGMDPSYKNWGLCKGLYNTDTHKIHMQDVSLLKIPVVKNRKLRKQMTAFEKAEIDITRSIQLIKALDLYLQNCQVIFTEIPHGSQNSRAAVSMGILLALLGYIEKDRKLIKVVANDIKLATIGHAQATKNEIVDRAVSLCPNLNWPTSKCQEQKRIDYGTAEHMADAMGAIEAGINLPEFKSYLTQYNN